MNTVRQVVNHLIVACLALAAVTVGFAETASAQWIGYADVVLDYYNSGTGDFPGPYGRASGSMSAPVEVALDVVVGDEDSLISDILSLPTGSYVTVGFVDETIIDGPGNDIFIKEEGAAGDRANIFVSSNDIDYVFLGVGQDDVTTSFDLADIGFTEPVTSVKIVGLNALGLSKGFDVVHVRVLPGSIGAPEETLRTPIHSKFNTFLGQSNYLELTSAGTDGFPVEITIYNLAGGEMISQEVTLGASSQLDVDINALIVSACATNPSSCAGLSDLDGNGVVDTYGVVRLDFFEEVVGEDKVLLGRVTNYRQNSDGNGFDFAFAKELRNPLQGPSFSGSNTFHPLFLGAVPNWTEVINLDLTASKSFTYNLYTMSGVRVYTESFTLPSLGERDIQAGHELEDSSGTPMQAVYLVEVIPNDTTADYLMSVSRYSRNLGDGTYNYAFAIDGTGGNDDTLYVPISNENRATSNCAVTQNWLEVVNVLNVPVSATVTFRSDIGAIRAQETITLAPRAQFHFNASGMLNLGSLGLAEISSTTANSLVAQSLVYYQDCDRNGVQTAFSTPAKTVNRDVRAVGTLNTFLNMESSLRAFNTTSGAANVVFSVASFRGDSGSESRSLNLYAGEEISISYSSAVDFPADTNGTVTMITGDAGDVFAQTLRVHTKVDSGYNRLDFVIPGLLR